MLYHPRTDPHHTTRAEQDDIRRATANAKALRRSHIQIQILGWTLSIIGIVFAAWLVGCRP